MMLKDSRPVAKAGHSVFIISDHLQTEGMFIVPACQVPVNMFLKFQEVAVIVKEHQDVRFFGRSNFHPAEYHQSVPFRRLFHGKDVLRRVMVAYAEQADALPDRRIHDLAG